MAITILLTHGSQEQKSRYLTILSKTNALAGIAVMNGVEISKGDLQAEERDGAIVLNGHCALVLNAAFAEWLVVTCLCKEKANAQAGKAVSITKAAHFIVPGKIKGLKLLEATPSLGRKAANACSMYFDKVELEPIAKIDISDRHYSDTNILLNSIDICLPSSAAIICAGCLGLGNAAFEHAKKYAQARETFGIPIAKHQAIAFMMADMMTELEAARAMTYATVRSLSASRNNLKLALSTLIFGLQTAARISNDAVQIFGAYGYTKDYPVEKLMRDAKSYQLLYGGSREEILLDK